MAVGPLSLGYADPVVASTVANALMLAGERQGACAVVRQSRPRPG